MCADVMLDLSAEFQKQTLSEHDSSGQQVVRKCLYTDKQTSARPHLFIKTEECEQTLLLELPCSG